MVEALMYEREKMFRNFFEATTTPNKNKNLNMVMKMKSEMVKLVKQNHILTGKYNKLKDKALSLLDIVKGQKNRITLLESKIKQMSNVNTVNNQEEDNSRKDIYIPANTPSVTVSNKPFTQNTSSEYSTEYRQTNNFEYNRTPRLVNTRDISSIIVEEKSDSDLDDNTLNNQPDRDLQESQYEQPLQVQQAQNQQKIYEQEPERDKENESEQESEQEEAQQNNNFMSLSKDEFFMDLN